MGGQARVIINVRKHALHRGVHHGTPFVMVGAHTLADLLTTALRDLSTFAVVRRSVVFVQAHADNVVPVVRGVAAPALLDSGIALPRDHLIHHLKVHHPVARWGLVRARRLSQGTMRNIRQNLFFAFLYHVLGVPIAVGILYPVLGLLLSPMIASTAMTLSSVSVIANALRLRHLRL
jgi:hypothetical protein